MIFNTLHSLQFFFVLLLHLISPVSNQVVDPNDNPNCSDCVSASAILANCGFFPLDTPYTDLSSRPRIFRNVSHAPDSPVWDIDGPSSKLIATAEDAACTCTTGRLHFDACRSCTTNSDAGSIGENQKWTTFFYDGECKSWGYYEDTVNAYPSTTITAMPTAVPPVADPVIKDCPVCDILSAQIYQCNLPHLSNDLTSLPLGNRTAAECLCTLPVIRRFTACYYCTLAPGGFENDAITSYRAGCSEYGYYSDSMAVLPSARGSASSSGSASGSSPTAKSNDTNEGGRAAHGSSTLCSWFILLSITRFLMG